MVKVVNIHIRLNKLVYMDENISVLKGIGLTLYEAQAYVTLTSLISSTASEISDKSGIPRSKIYDVLKGLVKKNFIEVEDGRPMTYNVKSPVEVLSKEKERINFDIDDTITRLTYIYENSMSQVQAPIWRIYGVDKIISQELEIIKRAKTSINMRIGFLFESEGEQLVKALKNRQDLKINILASPTCYINDEKFDIISFFKENDIKEYLKIEEKLNQGIDTILEMAKYKKKYHTDGKSCNFAGRKGQRNSCRRQ